MLVAPDVYFHDPLNDVTGVDKMMAVFERLFDEFDYPRFKITDQAWGQGDKTAYLRWTFSYKQGGQAGKFEGVSEIKFNNDGKIILHRNYWDSRSRYLESLPLIGPALRFVMKTLSAR